MRIQIIHGVQKYNLELPDPAAAPADQQPEACENSSQVCNSAVNEEVANSQDEDSSQSCGDWNIRRLKEEIEKLTEIPCDGQRLIRKGATIFGDDKPLASLNLCTGDKIMVLGQKPEPPEDPAMKSLFTIERTVLDGIENKIKDVDGRLQGIQQGFLTKELVRPALSELDKQLKVLCEDCMKTLELMDAMRFSEEINDKARAKRKALVVRVQDILRRHDELKERLESISSDINTQRTNGVVIG